MKKWILSVIVIYIALASIFCINAANVDNITVSDNSIVNQHVVEDYGVSADLQLNNADNNYLDNDLVDDLKISQSNVELSQRNVVVNQNSDNLLSVSSNDVKLSVLGSSSNSNLKDLQELIKQTPKGSTLDLHDDYNTITDKLIIQIDKDIVIDGHGHTIDLAGSDHHDHYFKVTGGKVVFQNIRFINGYNNDDDNGGAILLKDSAIGEIYNCVFENCFAKKDGGAIAVKNNNMLIVKNSTFLNNHAEKYSGGAIWANDLIIIDNCTFKGNIAGDNGGALYAYRDANIQNTAFLDNKADSEGGAVFVRGSNTNIYDSIFENNYVKDDGGALHSEGNLNIQNTIFKKNKAGDCSGAVDAENKNGNTLNIYNSTFEGNVAGGDAGAIWIDHDKSNIEYCVFKDNKAGKTCGAICSKGTVYLLRCTYSNNLVGDFDKPFHIHRIQLDDFPISTEQTDLNLKISIVNETSIVITTDKMLLSDIVIVKINNETYTVSIIDGYGSTEINLPAGHYTATAFFKNNIMFKACSQSIDFDIICATNATSQTNDTHEFFLYSDYYESNYTYPALHPSGDIGSFKDLEAIINGLKPGDVYTFDRNYTFTGNSGININIDNVTLDGNFCIIDGMNSSSIFNVYGNNVRIVNLTICNACHQGLKQDTPDLTIVNSPVCWFGDDGMIDDCLFFGNSAVLGGAISWTGNNGLINNTIFLNNVARGAGGAIYVNGKNLTVSNSPFLDSDSLLVGEAIYLGRGSQGFNISDCTYDSILSIKADMIDIENLFYNIVSSVFNNKVNLLEMAYSAFVHNGTAGYLKDGTEYGGGFVEDVFSLEFAKYLANNVTLIKEYHFKNVNSMDDLFTALHNNKYDVNFIFIKNIIIGSEDPTVMNSDDEIKSEYECACKMTAKVAFEGIMDYFKNDGDIDFNTVSAALNKNGIAPENVAVFLNVNFAGTYNIYSRNTWMPSGKGFNVVNIYGNGTRIYANSGNRDEYKWADLKEDDMFLVSDLIIQGFNTAISLKGGSCTLNKVCFYLNVKDYIIDRDYGAAILNDGGIVTCTNCSFINNYSKNGGAIFNEGIMSVNNCTFIDNIAYGKGDDIFNQNEGIIVIDGINISCTNNIVECEVDSFSSGLVIFVGILTVVASSIIAYFCGKGITCISGSESLGSIVGWLLCMGFSSGITDLVLKHNYDLHFNRIAYVATVLALSAILGGISAYSGAIAGMEVYEDRMDAQALAEFRKNANLNSEININENIEDSLVEQNKRYVQSFFADEANYNELNQDKIVNLKIKTTGDKYLTFNSGQKVYQCKLTCDIDIPGFKSDIVLFSEGKFYRRITENIYREILSDSKWLQYLEIPEALNAQTTKPPIYQTMNWLFREDY